jgi:hypothetical protein
VNDPQDQNNRTPNLTDDQLLAEIRGATTMAEGWKLHHTHLTVLAFNRGIPVKDIADASGLTGNGVRYRAKLAQLDLGGEV